VTPAVVAPGGTWQEKFMRRNFEAWQSDPKKYVKPMQREKRYQRAVY